MFNSKAVLLNYKRGLVEYQDSLLLNMCTTVQFTQASHM